MYNFGECSSGSIENEVSLKNIDLCIGAYLRPDDVSGFQFCFDSTAALMSTALERTL